MTDKDWRIYADPGLVRVERRKRKTRLRIGLEPAVFADLRPDELRTLTGLLIGELVRLDGKGIR
jgi:hypothetical protein